MDPVKIQNLLQELAAASSQISPSDPTPEIPADLEKVLIELAHNGIPYYKWSLLQELFAVKLILVVNAYNSEFSYNAGPEAFQFDKRKSLMLMALRSFNEAPFTIQRLAEILIDPNRQYRATHKLMNGIEKLLAVSTTVPQAPPPLFQGAGEGSQESRPSVSAGQVPAVALDPMEIDSAPSNGASATAVGGEPPQQNHLQPHHLSPFISAGENTAAANGTSSMEA